MVRISWMLVSYLAAAVVILAGPDQPEQAIDTGRSSLTVHVGKAGLLSAAAHEHWVNAPIAGGAIAADGSTPAVRFAVDARRLSVRPDKGVRLTKTAPKCNPTCRPGPGIKCLSGHRFQINRGPANRRPCMAGVRGLDPAWGHKAGHRRSHPAKRRVCWRGSPQADGFWHSADQDRRRRCQGEG